MKSAGYLNTCKSSGIAEFFDYRIQLFYIILEALAVGLFELSPCRRVGAAADDTVFKSAVYY